MITKNQVEKVLSAKFRGIKLVELSKCSGGSISKVYSALCAYPQKEFIIKVYPANFHWKLEKEVYLYNLLNKRIKIPLPRVILHSASKKVIKRNFLILSKIEGDILKEKAKELSKKEVYKLYHQMGSILRKIHSIQFKKYGYMGTRILKPHKDNYEYMTSQFDKKLSEFLQFRGKKEAHDKIRAYVWKNRALFLQCKKASLCHNDYHEGNIMVNKVKDHFNINGVFDVENMLSGDPILDIAKTIYYSVKKDKNKLRGFLKGYGSLPKGWKERLKIYTLYHALELWDWFAKIHQKKWLKNIEKDLVQLSEA